MMIHVEPTPNPQSMKFMPGQAVIPLDTDVNKTYFFSNMDQASISPLAQILLSTRGVEAVFFGHDFITVTKNDSTIWDQLQPEILQILMEYFLSGRSVVQHCDAPASLSKPGSPSGDDPLTQQIRELIETRIRPAVAMDGGDITLDRFEDGIVYVHMKGACSGCPSSTATLKSGIENMLRYYVPEVIEVRPIEPESTE